MALNNSRFASVRVYRRYCFGAIFSGLLSLGVLGTFALLAFFPMFGYTMTGSDPIFVTGNQFVVYVLGHYFPALAPGEPFQNQAFSDAFTASMAAYTGGNPFMAFIATNYGYIETGVVALLAIALIFGVIIGIIGLFWILLGRIHKNRAPSAFSKSVFFFDLFFVGLLFLYLFFANEVNKGGAANALAQFYLPFWPFIVVGAQLVLMIALSITYKVSFKDRVFAPRKKKGGADEPKMETFAAQPMNEQPVPAYQPQPQPQPQQNYGPGYEMREEPAPMKKVEGMTRLPEGLMEIGDRAFAKNTTLRDASIPSGVNKLGASAFSNCLNLETVIIPLTVTEIGYNCFFNTPNLKKITYAGKVEDWKKIEKGSNWLSYSGVNIIDAIDGKIAVNNQ